MYPAYSGTIVDIDGDGILILQEESQLTAIVEPDETPSDMYIYSRVDNKYYPISAEQAITLAISSISANERFRIRFTKEGWQHRVSYTQ